MPLHKYKVSQVPLRKYKVSQVPLRKYKVSQVPLRKIQGEMGHTLLNSSHNINTMCMFEIQANFCIYLNKDFFNQTQDISKE